MYSVGMMSKFTSSRILASKKMTFCGRSAENIDKCAINYKELIASQSAPRLYDSTMFITIAPTVNALLP